MQKKYFFLLLLLTIYKPIEAQQVNLSVYSEISMVTVGPGKELFVAFGHSAIRIKDPVLNLDLIYNYGVFNFDTPNFLLNFAKGNMIYSLARYDFKYFLASYKIEKRWLKQQVLNLTQQEKQAYFNFLENNALPENRNYLYDPYFDNCATKLRDITQKVLANKLTFNNNSLEKGLTLRQLTNQEICWNSWGAFGLNVIAGTKLDKKVTLKEYLFLPDYIYSTFKNATVTINNKPKKLVKREEVLLDFNEIQPTSSIFSPFLIFSLLTLLVGFITYKDFKNNKSTKWLDFSLFFTTGFIGCALIFLWFFSTHSTAPNNFNILWAFAPNLIIAFLIFKKSQKDWLVYYYKALVFMLIIITVLWILGVQEFPIAVIPLLILLGIRYLFLSKKMIVSNK